MKELGRVTTKALKIVLTLSPKYIHIFISCKNVKTFKEMYEQFWAQDFGQMNALKGNNCKAN